MKWKYLPLLIFLACWVLIPLAGATYHFRNSFRVRSGTILHLGSEWISTSGTDVLCSTWFIDNWVNFSVSTSGVQQVYNGSKPESVLIDGVNQTEGSGWTYGLGIVTVTTATSSVNINWAEETIPPIIPPVASLLVPFGTPQTSVEVYGDCIFSFYPQESLVCQHSENIEMEVTVLSGAFNGSGTVELNSNHGRIMISPTTDSIIQFTDLLSSGLSVSVDGHNVNFGEGVPIASSSNIVTIEWSRHLNPLIPITFIIGMIGLGSLFGGPILAINRFREHEYKNGFVIGVVLVTAGIGLVLTWLYA